MVAVDCQAPAWSSSRLSRPPLQASTQGTRRVWQVVDGCPYPGTKRGGVSFSVFCSWGNDIALGQ